ncbi:MAG: right-handed parallel beta-helix repeat-containing protein [Myxococcota bacterium]
MKQLIVACSILCIVVLGCSPSEDRPNESDADPTDASSADTSGADGSAMDTSRTDTTDTSEDDTSDAFDAADASDGIVFRVTSPRSDRAVGFQVKVTVEPERVQDGSRFEAEESDEIVEQSDGWLISGETGTAPSSERVHGDTFRWPTVQDPQYAILGWSADAPASDYTITINGEEVDPASLPALTTESQTPCLGGGDCYDALVTAADASIVVGASATLSDLQAALASASSGDVVFVDPAAEIDLGFFPDAPSIEVPAGVTLASNRGVDGSQGARLHADKKLGSDWVGSDTILVNDNARITGLRIEGPTPDRDMNWLGADHDYTDGIEAKGTSGVEIDNNEIYGWPTAAVHGGEPIQVHHNFIHDNDQSGLGYGVSATMWGSVIEYNRFERNRHAVAGSGAVGEGYILRYNTFGAEGIGGAGHKIDMHEDPDNPGHAGSRMEIYGNTVEFSNAQGVFLRATPRESAEIYNNWFYNSTPPCLTQDRGSYCAIEVKASDWTNVDYHDNHYGSSEPTCDIGAPRDDC